jgi:hypothetical protein
VAAVIPTDTEFLLRARTRGEHACLVDARLHHASAKAWSCPTFWAIRLIFAIGVPNAGSFVTIP